MCELCEQLGDVLVQTSHWRVVLVKDVNYPGFCRVIWNQHVREMSDLCLLQRTQLMNVVWQVEEVIRAVMQPHKINLASLGNVVPHLHWHIIPRYQDDPHFPDPIWGRVHQAVSPHLMARQARADLLRTAIPQRLVAPLISSYRLKTA
jgi:diadenosine tetraphosphate (Ap4A) HIT family hydrolase